MKNRVAFVLCLFPVLLSGLLGRVFHDLTYEDIESASKDIDSDYALVKSPHDLYGLPYAHSKDGFQCSPSIIRVSHLKTLGKDLKRPQILISGEIHGDERVGPPSTLHVAQLLVWSAMCEIEKKVVFCKKLQDFSSSISKGQRLWLALLATRRDSFLIPTANCLGHKFRRRDDNFIDPNRDFPYSRGNNACMMSTTAKIFDKLMQNNIIQLVITYHGGMAALGYEWGSKNHPAPQDASPDNNANKHIASMLTEYGSSAGSGESPYKANRINSIVYAVDGGMEDWMYAAGWDKALVRQDCLGYKKANQRKLRQESDDSLAEDHVTVQAETITEENHETLDKIHRWLSVSNNTDTPSSSTSLSGNRALVFLVETSDAKSPKDTALGGTAEVLYPNGQENGHIPRNIRLGLMAIDSLEPYVCMSQTRLTTNNVSASTSQSFLHLKWYVGGAHTVDKTFLTLSRAPSAAQLVSLGWSHYMDMLPSDSVLDDLLLTKNANFSSSNGAFFSGRNRSSPKLISPIFSGMSRWHESTTENNIAVSHPTDENVYDENDPLRPQSEYTLAVNLSRVFTHRKRKLSDPTSSWSIASFASSLFSTVSSSSSSSSAAENNKLDAKTVHLEHAQHQERISNDAEALSASMHHRPRHSHTRHPRRRRRLAAASDNNGNLAGASSSSSAVANPSVKGKYWIVAWAMVDQSYGVVGQGQPTTSHPMSYYANIRTRSTTHCERTGPDARTCQGRRYWPSDFIELDVLEDGKVAHMRHVLHCATWSMPSPQSASASAVPVSVSSADNDLMYQQEHQQQQQFLQHKAPIASFQSDVEESYAFEQSYMFVFLMLLFVVLVVWHVSSYMRRNRIYASVTSNKYLKLPTGFRSAPQSPMSLSTSSSQASLLSSSTPPPSSPLPPYSLQRVNSLTQAVTTVV